MIHGTIHSSSLVDGFGRAMVEEALSNGDIMATMLRKPSVLDDLAIKYSPTQPLVIELDVTNEDQVKHAFGRVHVVYNNASQMFLQEPETTSIERARALMDVNFWDAIAASFEAVRFFREKNPKGLGGCSCKYRVCLEHQVSHTRRSCPSEVLEPPALYSSEPSAVMTKARAGGDAFVSSDALAATKRI
ncbi:hypothetical protein AZE42_03715 [Rhizopogon vesiculosus]|uniref:Ketoreductase (KR) domain-containing protein n=1 Tax=Rhizopogon vesiculosus TaxID=180088 RepID=A0A1J8QJ63_9AGAM|nr:hypothetical protein AZE42_03715 [Rhizopogon vesiculosus]